MKTRNAKIRNAVRKYLANEYDNPALAQAWLRRCIALCAEKFGGSHGCAVAMRLIEESR